MADDIVQELLDWAHTVDDAQGKAVVAMLNGAVFRDAAAEIERLRAETERLTVLARRHESVISSLEAEITMLRVITL